MTDYQIPISYVVSASAVLPSAGIEPLKLSTILILTNDEPVTEITGDYAIYRTVTSAVNDWGTESTTTKMVQAIFGQTPNILNNNGYVIIAPYASEEETYSEAIQRIAGQIYFNGVLTTKTLTDEEAIAASNTVQALQPARMMFLESSNADALISPNGLFYTVKSNYYTKTLYHADTNEAKLFASAYASKLLSVNYEGSNTCITMNLKDLSGVKVDTSISETVLQRCVEAGCDVYCSIEGLPKVLANRQGAYYSDQVQNSIWLVNTVQRNVFNLLATTRTKIPQTEQGMQLITSSIAQVCRQGVNNGYLAPGVWNSADTFGEYEDFMRNIEENGYYIYHLPIAQQSQMEREQRKAPNSMVACKEAGAVHSSNVLIYIEP